MSKSYCPAFIKPDFPICRYVSFMFHHFCLCIFVYESRQNYWGFPDFCSSQYLHLDFRGRQKLEKRINISRFWSKIRKLRAHHASAIYQAQRGWRSFGLASKEKASSFFNISTRWTKFMLKKMNFFIFLSLGITLALGIPDSEWPLYDYESYDYMNDGIVRPLIGGESEFPAIDNVSFVPLCYFNTYSLAVFTCSFLGWSPLVNMTIRLLPGITIAGEPSFQNMVLPRLHIVFMINVIISILTPKFELEIKILRIKMTIFLLKPMISLQSLNTMVMVEKDLKMT